MPARQLTLLFLMVAAFASQAQVLPEGDLIPHAHFKEVPVEAKLYGVDDGLSQGLIYGMVMDHDGRLWLATKDGLNCYNGRGFRTFRHEATDILSMAHDQVQSLSMDTLGMLWLVYTNGTVGRFDPATETFTKLRAPSNNRLNFREVQRMPDGGMVFRSMDSTGHSMYFLTDLPEKYAAQAPLSLQPIENEIPDIQFSKHFYEKRQSLVSFTTDGTLWLADLDSIYRYGHLPGTSTPEWTSFAMPQMRSALNEQYVNFAADPDGTTAFAVDRSLVLHRYDVQQNAFTPMLRLPEDTRLSGGAFLDCQKRLYLFHNDSELLRINTRNAECERLLLQWSRSFLSLNLQMHTILEDGHGNLWIGTPGGGVVQINHNNDRFTAFKPPFKSYEAGVYQYRTHQPGQQHHYDPQAMQAWQNFRKRFFDDALFSARVALDASEHFWAVCIESDVFSWLCMDSSSGRTQVMFSEAPGAHQFGRHFFTGSDGRIWISIHQPDAPAGLWSYESRTGLMETYAIPPLPADDDYPGISDSYETPEGHWWLATTKGLFFFNPDSKDWKQFLHLPGDSTSLSGDLTLSICPDPTEPERYLWVGTEGAGLNRFDLQRSRFRRYTVDDGLPNNVVYGILPDSRNNLWISTNKGVSHFYVKENKFVNYNASNGLAGNEFNRYEYAGDDRGNLYFGGTAGITIIHPERFYQAVSPSKTLITGLKVQNARVEYHHDKAGILKAPIHATKRIVLPHDHRMFALEFANLDLSVPSENTFKYMLEGFDKEWINAGTATEATYTNLHPGNYEFKVMGCNSFRAWQEVPTTIAIDILTPWWATWCFRTLMLLLIATALYGLYRYRLNSLLEMERLRNRIAQDLHDEIGSTLSSISLYSAVMQKSSKSLPQNTHAILEKIIDSTSEIMENMSDMVWTIKSDNDHFRQVVHRMRAFAANVADSKGIALRFDAQARVEELRLDMDKRKNVYLIYKEAVINAVKYAECTELQIDLRKTNHNIELHIRDNGKGFDPGSVDYSESSLGGNGLTGMALRAEKLGADFRIDAAPGQGTTISLKLPVNH